MCGSRAACALALTFACAVSGATPLAALDAPEVLARVQGWLDGTETLAGGFEQVLVSGAFGAGEGESGRLWVERPGRMRWEYLEPEHKIAIVDGARTWLYVEEDAELLLGRLEGDDQLLPHLLAGTGRLTDLFGVALDATPQVGGDGAYRLRLSPAGEGRQFEQVLLTVRPPSFSIEEVEVLDPAGNRVLYRFSGLERNGRLPEGLFSFDPPEGTGVSGRH